ncbi:hypothetical protein JCM10908_000856 [Rhodotorula pacifica]|uniref:uncharacterized protein n=1 Tax=Rhodotorula pacifica TaxID=1495444 RepID=UPI003172AB06
MAPPAKRSRGGAASAAAATTDKKYRRGSSSSWAGGSGKRGGAGRGGGVKGQALGRGRGRGSGRGRAPNKAARLDRAAAAADGTASRQQRPAEEEEWNGIQSSPEPVETADAMSQDEEDASDDDAEEDTRPAPPPPAAKKKQRKPTGGTGKKQKVFVEGKNDLLALAASVSGDVAKKTQAKVEKAKSKPVKPVESKDRRHEPSDAKKNQIAAARAVVAARTKAKKEGDRAAAADPEPVAEPSTAAAKKGVRFA